MDITDADRALAKMFAGPDEDWLAVDLKLNREKSDPAVLQRKVDKLMHDEVQLRLLMREAVL
jgi:hypothetical protein